MKLADRVFAKVNREGADGCWLWTGSTSSGYGQIMDNYRNLRVHRVVYELTRGPIPVGLQLDHLCRVRHCVNPDHLEPVTNRENAIRGVMPQQTRARMLARTHCKRGHPFVGDNLHITPAGARECRACKRLHALRPNVTKPQVRGPLQDCVRREGGMTWLACGHSQRRDSRYKEPRRMRCTDCQALLDAEAARQEGRTPCESS